TNPRDPIAHMRLRRFLIDGSGWAGIWVTERARAELSQGIIRGVGSNADKGVGNGIYITGSGIVGADHLEIERAHANGVAVQGGSITATAISVRSSLGDRRDGDFGAGLASFGDPENHVVLRQ